MKIGILYLVQSLGKFPGFEYQASNGIHIKLSADGRQIEYFWSLPNEFTKQEMYDAQYEAFCKAA